MDQITLFHGTDERTAVEIGAGLKKLYGIVFPDKPALSGNLTSDRAFAEDYGRLGS